MDLKTLSITPGEPLPLGLHECLGGMNIAVFSRHATAMCLLLFDDPEAVEPALAVDLDPADHRTGDVWHVRLGGEPRRLSYVLRAAGPEKSEDGHRFTPHRDLLDPYSPLVALAARGAGDDGKADAVGYRCLVTDQHFDWQGVRQPRRPWSETILYETHVRGLTVHPSSGARHPGQYLGVIEKIPYFKELGVTAYCATPFRF